MIISRDLKMAELIHQNYEVLTVLRRFNLNLGFGDKTIEEVCSKAQINVDFFLEIVNSFNDVDYFPQSKLKNHDVEDILFYLKNTHQFYLDRKFPEIEATIQRLEFVENNQKNKMLIENFFKEYKDEFFNHVKREEDRIYPYIIRLDKALKTSKTDMEFHENMKKYSISDYQQEHEDVEEKLYDLKNLIIKYLPSPINPVDYNAILIKLFKLENDLNEHSRIEDKVIIPKVTEMEKAYHLAVELKKMQIV